MRIKNYVCMCVCCLFVLNAHAVSSACQAQYKLLAGCADGQPCTLTDVQVGSYMIYDESAYNPTAPLKVTFQPLLDQCSGADFGELIGVMFLPALGSENIFEFNVDDKAAEHWLAILQMAKNSGTKISVRYVGQSSGSVEPNMIGLGGGL